MDRETVVTRVWEVRPPAQGRVRTRLVWLRGVEGRDGPELRFAVPPGVDLGRARPVGACCVRVLEVPPGDPGLPGPPDLREGPTMRSVCEVGLWATLGDFVVTPEGGANVFGVRIAAEVMRAWAAPGGLRALLFERDAAAGMACPIVTYHGGSAEMLADLRGGTGALREDAPQGEGHAGDPPMMGRGVYTGAYWKARRFALWTGSHRPRPRPGAVVRTVAFIEAPRVKAHTKPHAAPVDNAYIRRFFHSNPKRAAELSQWVDHDGAWRAAHDAIYVSAAACPLVRSDEWAIKAEFLVACDAATPRPADGYDAGDRGPATRIQ